MSWDPPDFDGGSPIIHYVLQVSLLFGPLGPSFGGALRGHMQKLTVPLRIDVQRREAGRRTYVNMMSGENKVSWNVKDLISSGEYYFRVQAVNKIGGGEFIELRNPVIAEDQKRTIFAIIAMVLVS